MKKNNFKSLAAVLSLAMAATAVPVNANAAAAPKITVSKKTVYSGKTYSTTVTNLKKGYTVQFSSTQGGVNFKTKKVKATGKKVTAKFTVKAAKSIADGSKTKIKAVVKNAKGKTVKTVSQSVTLKQLAKSLTVKDVEKTTVTVGEIVNADATISPAAAKGAYKKTFTSSDSAILKVTNASNGLFEAVAPGKATISVSAVNNKGKVVEGSKTIEITVVAAEKPDEKPDDKPTTGPGIDVTGPAIVTEYQLSLTPGKTTITANSKDQTKIGILLKAPTETAATDKMKVAVDVVLGTSNIGSLSQNDVTLIYDAEKGGWYNEITFTSATLQNAVKSTIKANVRSVVDGPEGEQIVGVSSNEVVIELVPEKATDVDTTVAVRATKAVVESCDRITLTFNQDVDVKSFLTADGKVADGTNSQTVNGVISSPTAFHLYLQDKVNEQNDGKDLSKYTDYSKQIAAIEQTSSRELTFVFKDNYELSDNSKFLCKFFDTHTTSTSESDVLANYITDTSTPTVMSVEEVDMRTIRVTFDQPVVSYDASKEQSALRKLNYAIDGCNLNSETTYKKDGKDYSLFGSDITIKIPDEAKVKRNAIDIVLGKASEGLSGNGGEQCYFAAGQHVIQISSVGDYASLSEVNKNNMITTKSFNFTIKPNTTAPSFDVEVQSPEQYIINFTTPIVQLDGIEIGQQLTDKQVKDMDLGLYYKDSAVVKADNTTFAMTEFKDATAAYAAGAGTGLGQEIQVTRIEDDEKGNPRLKMEVTKDWTQLEDYKANNKIYMNYTLAIHLGKDMLTNAANGVKSGDVKTKVLTGAVTSYDGVSPEITALTAVSQDKNVSVFDVTFNEPVQAGNSVFTATTYAHANTPSYSKITGRTEAMSDMTVKIVSSTNRVYDAEITGYSNLEDHIIRVKTTSLPAGSYTLYATAVSDDAGNTCKTVSTTFAVAGETAAASEFKVLSILADKTMDEKAYTVSAGGVATAAGVGVTVLNNTENVGADVIYVEFSSQYKVAPMDVSVLNTANWTINGASLPVGSYISAGIKGTDFTNMDTTKNYSGVTIMLPQGTLTNIHTTSVKLNANVQNSAGTALTGQTTFSTPSIFKGSYFSLNRTNKPIYVEDNDGSYYVLNASEATKENK